MSLSGLIKYWNTGKYLKFVQIYYRLYYFIRKRIRYVGNQTYLISKKSSKLNLNLLDSIPSNKSYHYNNTFEFLNLKISFKNKINWNFSENGKLWTYNLNYFNYLNQKDISKAEGLMLIKNFITDINSVKDGLDPYPISLRGINWIKFLTRQNIYDHKINDCLYAQYYILVDNIEYHLLGNHLLENGFSLLFGACYFKDNNLYKKAKKILITQLEEQILKDGGHYELSPMYHQIIFLRLMDCLNLVKSNDNFGGKLLPILFKKASLMYSWLKNISFEDGSIPLLNDSANKVAPSSDQLFEYAQKLEISNPKMELGDSGYRKIKQKKYKAVIDIGDIGPDYIPGHAHCDIFNFHLQVKGKPFIVDTGTSTYENISRRIIERSTKAHNTVHVAGVDQSEMWDVFKVARRAKVLGVKEEVNQIEAFHDGYKRIGAYHSRTFEYSENSFKITDFVKAKKEIDCTFFLHFHPDISIELDSSGSVDCGICSIHFLNQDDLSIVQDFYSPEFNKLIETKMLLVNFKTNLKLITNIKIK